MEDMWPSPTALKLIMNRIHPSGRSAWFGCNTMEGLKSAADSMEYSIVKYAPINARFLSDITISSGMSFWIL